jgi:HAD superfamily hydrolase (TIGR01549 family)
MRASLPARIARRLRKMGAKLMVREVRPGPEMFELAKSCSAKVVSVDFFDTLVYRRCCSAHDVFLLVHARCPLLAPHMEAKTWVELRRSVEAQLAARATDEIRLADIHRALAARLGMSDSEADTVMQCELQVEQELIAPFDNVVQAMQQCHAAGMRIVVTTDTSLPPSFVRAQVARVLPFEHEILCSSETGSTKRSGRAYKLLAARYGDAGIVHVGDDAFADGVMAAHGVTAFRVRHPRAEFLARNRLFVEHLRELGIPRIETPYDAGGASALDLCRREVAWRWAVVLADMTLDLARYAREIDAHEIWFLSRDCESLFAALEAAAFRFAGARIRYVHASRAATYPVVALERPETFQRWTGRLPTFAHRREGEQLVQAYRSLANQPASRILTVDTGWRGRIQTCLQVALADQRVFGYYLSLVPASEPEITGFTRTYVTWNRSVVNQAAAETLAGFAASTCTGYQPSAQGGWRPAFKQPDGDAAPGAYREALVAYLTSHLRQLGQPPATSAGRRSASLRSLCAYPDRIVAQAFQGWGLGAGMGAAPSAPLLRGGRAGLAAKLLGREVSDNLWPELAMWSVSSRAWLVATLQALMSARKRMQNAVASRRTRPGNAVPALPDSTVPLAEQIGTKL